MKKYYEQLDSLRGFAVLGVLISHWVFLPFIQQLGLGFIGVNLFFVISGFLITEILYRDTESEHSNAYTLKKFYWRRTLRIFPIYYLVCFLTYIADFQNARELFLYNALYITNIYNYITGEEGGSFSHIWSLCVEEQFYLLWPAFILLTRHAKRTAIIVVIAIALIVRIAFWYYKPDNYAMFNYRMTPACFDGFGAGALLAYLKMYHTEHLKKYLKVIAIPLVCVALYLFDALYLHNSFINDVVSRFLISVISFYLIGYVVMDISTKYKLLNLSFVKYVGTISYGVYLYHLFVSNILESRVDALLNSNSFIQSSALKYNLYLIKFPLYTVITVLLAAFSHKYIESGFLKLKNIYK